MAGQATTCIQVRMALLAIGHYYMTKASDSTSYMSFRVSISMIPHTQGSVGR